MLSTADAKVCGSADCCLSRSLDSDGHVDWLIGQTDTFAGAAEMGECADYEIGQPPFSATLFHDGSDGLELEWLEVTAQKYLDTHKNILTADQHGGEAGAVLRGRGAGQPLLHRRDLRLVRDNVGNVTDDRIYTHAM